MSNMFPGIGQYAIDKQKQDSEYITQTKRMMDDITSIEVNGPLNTSEMLDRLDHIEKRLDHAERSDRIAKRNTWIQFVISTVLAAIAAIASVISLLSVVIIVLSL